MDSQYQIHPQQWRETSDPFVLNYNCFHPNEIIGYPTREMMYFMFVVPRMVMKPQHILKLPDKRELLLKMK